MYCHVERRPKWDIFYHGSFRHLGRIALRRCFTFTFCVEEFCSFIASPVNHSHMFGLKTGEKSHETLMKWFLYGKGTFCSTSNDVISNYIFSLLISKVFFLHIYVVYWDTKSEVMLSSKKDKNFSEMFTVHLLRSFFFSERGIFTVESTRLDWQKMDLMTVKTLMHQQHCSSY